MAFSHQADKVYSGGIDNLVKVWDLRRCTAAAEDAEEGQAGRGVEPVMKLEGHVDTITGMRVSPDGAYLLTNAMDCTLRIWDMRPYAPQVGEPLVANRRMQINKQHRHSNH